MHCDGHSTPLAPEYSFQKSMIIPIKAFLMQQKQNFNDMNDNIHLTSQGKVALFKPAEMTCIC